MGPLHWSASHAVFVTEVDDEHKEIFAAIGDLREAVTIRGPAIGVKKRLHHLISYLEGHFAHEERLMRAARYGSLPWHKRQHDAVARRVGELALRIYQGDTKAGFELIEYLA